MADQTARTARADAVPGDMTEAEKRANVIRLAFGGDLGCFEAFCETVRAAVPPGTAVVLRGSVVTEVLGLYKLTGFYVPGVHTIPLSDGHPDIAPDLVPLRRQLMDMVRRPVNIQGTRDFVMYLRGDLLGQPYLTLIGTVGE